MKSPLWEPIFQEAKIGSSLWAQMSTGMHHSTCLKHSTSLIFPVINCINLHGFADVHGVSIVWNPFLSNLHSPMACMAADLHPPLHKPWRLWLRPPWPGWDAVKPSISGGLFDLYHWKGKVSTQLKRKKRSEKNQVGCVVDVLLPKTEKRVGCFATINSHHQWPSGHSRAYLPSRGRCWRHLLPWPRPGSHRIWWGFMEVTMRLTWVESFLRLGLGV